MLESAQRYGALSIFTQSLPLLLASVDCSTYHFVSVTVAVGVWLCNLALRSAFSVLDYIDVLALSALMGPSGMSVHQSVRIPYLQTRCKCFSALMCT